MGEARCGGNKPELGLLWASRAGGTYAHCTHTPPVPAVTWPAVTWPAVPAVTWPAHILPPHQAYHPPAAASPLAVAAAAACVAAAAAAGAAAAGAAAAGAAASFAASADSALLVALQEYAVHAVEVSKAHAVACCHMRSQSQRAC